MTYQTPAGPKPPIPRFWRTAAIGFFILMLVFLGITAASINALTSVSIEKDDLKTQDARLIASLTAQLSKDNQTITANNAKIASLQAQITTLQTQASTDAATIASLKTQLAALEKANVVVIYNWMWKQNCFFICFSSTGTITQVVFANLGTTPANNAQLTVNFYSAPNGQGTFLCSVPTIFLGQMGYVGGQSINSLDSSQLSGAACKDPTASGNGFPVGTVTWS